MRLGELSGAEPVPGVGLLAGIDHGVWGGLSEDAPNTLSTRETGVTLPGGRQRRSSRAA
jgi:hypothetical protein